MSKTVSLKIDGMHCQACVRRVTMALGQVPGVKVERVEIGAAEVQAQQEVTVEQLTAAVGEMGFAAREA